MVRLMGEAEGDQMKIGVKPMGRVYTYPEVKQMLFDQRMAMIEEMSRKKDVIADARLYDEKLTDMYLHVESLRRMGFSRDDVFEFIYGVADISEEINSDQLDYKDMESGVDEFLGCHLKDEGLYNELKERAMK